MPTQRESQAGASNCLRQHGAVEMPSPRSENLKQAVFPAAGEGRWVDGEHHYCQADQELCQVHDPDEVGAHATHDSLLLVGKDPPRLRRHAASGRFDPGSEGIGGLAWLGLDEYETLRPRITTQANKVSEGNESKRVDQTGGPGGQAGDGESSAKDGDRVADSYAACGRNAAVNDCLTKSRDRRAFDLPRPPHRRVRRQSDEVDESALAADDDHGRQVKW